jgi:excisionase family DNA binding protein
MTDVRSDRSCCPAPSLVLALVMRSADNQIDYMNAQALATHLGVTERTVRRWIERGELPAERRGRAFSIRREDGERLLLGSFGARVVDDRAQLEDVASAKDRQLAELRGRYLELQDRLAYLEKELDAERRRAIQLEVERGATGEVRRAA